MVNFNSKTKNLFRLFKLQLIGIILMFPGVTINPVKAQVSVYTFASSTTTYTPISGTVLYTGAWDDGASSLITIPFTFTYDNLSYTTLSITANGFITLGAVMSGTIYCGLQNSPPNSIAGYGTDLVSSSGAVSSVQYATIGTTPNRKFVAQWTNCDHYNAGGIDHWTFQVILNETSNEIQVVWGGTTDVTAMGPNACFDDFDEAGNVGLLGTGGDFNIRSITNGVNTWATSVAGSVITDVCNMSSTNIPATGLTYTWTPIPPTPMVFVSDTVVFLNNMQEVAKGATNSPIIQVRVETFGSLSPFDVTSLDLSTAGCTNAAVDIVNAKVYYTGYSSSFSTANQFGSTVANPNGAFTVNGTATLFFGTNYFWITYDIASGANIGDTLSGCCTQITGTGTMGVQIPSVTCPAGFHIVAEIGFWTPLANLAPDPNGGEMMLLTDGTVIAKSFSGGGDGIGNIWNKLTPDSTGSYVNGTWTTIAPMFNTRLYFSSQILMDGRVYIAGGEYGSGGQLGETYNPLTNVWTMCPAFGQTFSDANSELLPDGRVLNALVNMPGPVDNVIYNPVNNTYIAGPPCIGSHNESSWVKLPDSSIVMVDMGTVNSERYIPSLNTWIADATVPVQLYDAIFETGPAFLLPDGRAFFIGGGTGKTAYYTPSGNLTPGVWAAGPDMPGMQGVVDGPAAMMVNGKILMAVAPPGTFSPPTSFYEFNYLSNSYTSISAPDGSPSFNEPTYVSNMLDLPDGNVLYGHFDSAQYYIYTPAGNPLASGKPTISGVVQTGCNSFTLYGTLFNGISEGACYGDDWQMATNYPIVRLTSATQHVYYARTFNWNSTGVMRGNLPDSTEFTIPAGLPVGTYSLVVIANGISSDTIAFTPSYPAVLSSTLTPPDICTNTPFTYIPTSTTTGATFTWTRAAVAGISNPAVTIPQTTNPNEVLINTTVNPVSVIYTYIISSGGCSSTQQVTVVVNPALATISGDSSVCSGSSTTLTATTGTNYLWSNSATTVSITISPSAATAYSVIVTNSYGCTDTASVTVAVNSLPTPSITASGDTIFCQGDSVMLNAGTFASYIWSNSSTTAAITVYSSGIHSVMVTDNNGCTGSDSIEVSVNPLPAVTFTGLPDTVCTYNGPDTLTGNPPGGTFTGSGITGNVFTPASAAVGNNTITYSFTDSLGCQNSDSMIVYVSLCTGISETASLPYAVVVYPNPASNMVTLEFSVKDGGNYLVRLADMSGRIIMEEEDKAVAGNNSHLINLEKIDNGIYMIILRKGNNEYKTKIAVD